MTERAGGTVGPTTLGLAATGAWLVAGLGVVWGLWPRFSAMAPHEWGAFLLGFLAPLAFLWLVLGYFQMGRTLSRQHEALRLQEEELKKQVEAIAALVRASEDRLDLEKQVRLEREREAKERRQPGFLAVGRDSTPRAIVVHVANRGGAAWNVRAALDGEYLTVQGGSYVPPGGELEVHVPQDRYGEPGRLAFEYTDADGDDEEKEYRYDGRAGFQPWGPHDWPSVARGGWNPA